MPICPKCNSSFEDETDSKYKRKFCSRACANSRIISKEGKELRSKTIKETLSKFTKEEFSQRTKAGAEKRSQTRIEKLLQADTSSLGYDSLRKRILLEQNDRCNRCGIDQWLGEPISLELEHKDGDHDNNIRDNLECLCPNCHALTPTWRGRNRKNK